MPVGACATKTPPLSGLCQKTPLLGLDCWLCFCGVGVLKLKLTLSISYSVQSLTSFFSSQFFSGHDLSLRCYMADG